MTELTLSENNYLDPTVLNELCRPGANREGLSIPPHMKEIILIVQNIVSETRINALAILNNNWLDDSDSKEILLSGKNTAFNPQILALSIDHSHLRNIPFMTNNSSGDGLRIPLSLVQLRQKSHEEIAYGTNSTDLWNQTEFPWLRAFKNLRQLTKASFSKGHPDTKLFRTALLETHREKYGYRPILLGGIREATDINVGEIENGSKKTQVDLRGQLELTAFSLIEPFIYPGESIPTETGLHIYVAVDRTWGGKSRETIDQYLQELSSQE